MTRPTSPYRPGNFSFARRGLGLTSPTHRSARSWSRDLARSWRAAAAAPADARMPGNSLSVPAREPTAQPSMSRELAPPRRARARLRPRCIVAAGPAPRPWIALGDPDRARQAAGSAAGLGRRRGQTGILAEEAAVVTLGHILRVTEAARRNAEARGRADRRLPRGKGTPGWITGQTPARIGICCARARRDPRSARNRFGRRSSLACRLPGMTCRSRSASCSTGACARRPQAPLYDDLWCRSGAFAPTTSTPTPTRSRTAAPNRRYRSMRIGMLGPRRAGNAAARSRVLPACLSKAVRSGARLLGCRSHRRGGDLSGAETRRSRWAPAICQRRA